MIENPARYSALSPEWFTPSEIVEAARELMDGIDLDPASCQEANKIIRAARYYEELDDGLVPWNPWTGSVFLNPPGGVTALDEETGKRKRIKPSLVRPFWERLCLEWRAGTVTQAIWIGYSLEQLQTLQSSPDSPLDFALCFPRTRIKFGSSEGVPESPTHANYIAWLPPSLRGSDRFGDLFEGFGKIKER